MPDGAEFLKMMEMKVEEKEDKLELILRSSIPDLNLLLSTIVQFGDRIFKTEIKFLLEFVLDLSYDLAETVTNTKSTVYDVLTKDIRIKFIYKASEFVTALKELMIASNAFEGLSYVTDDAETLWLIGMVSAHECDLNLRFKNPPLNAPEQQTLM